MTHDEALAYALSKPGAYPDEPWEGDRVAKVAEKIFVFGGSAEPGSIGVKCGDNRDEADELISRYRDDVSVLAYIGRSGWNSVSLGGGVPEDEIRELIDESYDRVVAKLPKSRRP